MALRLRTALPLVALLGLAVRVVYVLANSMPVQGDAQVYHLEGGLLADGEGFRRVLEDVPTAEFPPMHIILVAFANLLGLDGTKEQKLFFACVGTVTVVLVALLARAVTRSDRTAIVAGLLAALYPMLWLPDGLLPHVITWTREGYVPAGDEPYPGPRREGGGTEAGGAPTLANA